MSCFRFRHCLTFRCVLFCSFVVVVVLLLLLLLLLLVLLLCVLLLLVLLLRVLVLIQKATQKWEQLEFELREKADSGEAVDLASTLVRAMISFLNLTFPGPETQGNGTAGCRSTAGCTLQCHPASLD